MVIVTLLLTSTKVSQVNNMSKSQCRKDANKKKATYKIENGERTANTHRNVNGNPGPKES